jgi:hypothetical protein
MSTNYMDIKGVGLLINNTLIEKDNVVSATKVFGHV